MLDGGSMSETQAECQMGRVREGWRVVGVSFNVFLYTDHSQIGLLDGHTALAILSLSILALHVA